MKSVNKVILIGNLTRDPEVVSLNSGTDVAKFSLAINDSYKKADGEMVENTIYMDCEAWSGLAKVVSTYVKKGSKVYVEGSLKEDKWTDADSGKQRSKFKLRITDLMMLDGRKSDDSGYSGGGSSSYSNNNNDDMKVKPAQDDELPF